VSTSIEEYRSKVLACAAIGRKLMESKSDQKMLIGTINRFTEIINYEFNESKNFVNLLLLRNCVNSMPGDVSLLVIKERAERKDIDNRYLEYLNLNNLYRDYVTLTPDGKRELFIQLDALKEELKQLSVILEKIKNGEAPSLGGGIYNPDANLSDFTHEQIEEEKKEMRQKMLEAKWQLNTSRMCLIGLGTSILGQQIS